MLTGVKLIALLTVFAAAALAQERYATHVCVTSRTGVTTEKVTIQGVAATPVTVQLTNWSILATVAGTVKFERSGTAATTTAGVVTPVNPDGSSSKMACYSNSNVGTGTTNSITYKLTANVERVFNMRDISFRADSTTDNVTAVITLDSSGDVQNQVNQREQ